MVTSVSLVVVGWHSLGRFAGHEADCALVLDYQDAVPHPDLAGKQRMPNVEVGGPVDGVLLECTKASLP